MRPELDIKFESNIVDGNLNSARDRVDLADSIEDNVDGGDEYFPHAVERKKISNKVEIFSFQRFGPVQSLQHGVFVDQFEIQLAGQFFQNATVFFQFGQIFLARHGNRTDETIPEGGRRVESIFFLLQEQNATFFGRNVVIGLQQLSFGRRDLRLTDVSHEIRHRSVRIVDSTETGQNGHDGHTDHSDARDALFNRKDAMFGAENGKRVANLPEEEEEKNPGDGRENVDQVRLDDANIGDENVANVEGQQEDQHEQHPVEKRFEQQIARTVRLERKKLGSV